MNYCELYKSRRERERDEILYFKYLYMARVSIFINKYLYWNSYKYCKKKKRSYFYSRLLSSFTYDTIGS